MPEWTLALNNKIIKRFTIEEGAAITIGRSSDADVVIDNAAISRQHATLELKGGQYYITDHYSLNGTKVNGEKIEAAVPVSEEDFIEIGKFVLAPALEGEESGFSSFSSSLDMNDDTIIISHKDRPKAPQAGAKPKSPHRLVVLKGEAQPAELYLAGKKNIKIGKDKSCDIVVSGTLASGTLCFVVLKENTYFVVPQKTFIGATSINGKKIKEETSLRHGDVIETGKVKIRFD